MGSCFETEITTAGKILTNLFWFWRIRIFLWVEALPFQQNIVHQVLVYFSDCSVMYPDHSSQTSLGRLMLPHLPSALEQNIVV